MAKRSVSIDVAEYERLLENERVLQTLLENLPVMIFQGVNDERMTLDGVSHGCIGVTGYQPDDLISGRVSYASLIVAEDRDWVREGVQAAVDAQTTFDQTYCITAASGELRWVWAQGQGRYDPDGQPFGIEGFVIDVTERMRSYELLEERVDARTRELRTLLDASQTITATLDLDDLFERVFDQVQQVVTYTGCTIVVREDETFVRRASRYTAGGSPIEPEGYRFVLNLDNPIDRGVLQGEALLLDDVLEDSELAAGWRRRVAQRSEQAIRQVRSWMLVPLRTSEKIVGFMTLTHVQPGRFTAHELELVGAIANHVATAVENARLHGEARKLAAVEERQRLARELHDSISQALYGISLGAQTARTQLERDPAAVIQPLDYVVELAQAGMAEMRALIFELRPESLETEGLAAALEKQAAAIRARQRLSIELTLGSEPDWLSLDAKEALYRIAQESMHNTVKHAEAGWIGLRLFSTPNNLVLEIVDDGKGFDPAASFPGHLGLVSMRERMLALGGSLAIESEPGNGTAVRAEIRRQA